MPTLLHRPEVWLLTFVLAVIYPIVDYFLYARLKSALQIYIWNVLAAWTLTIATVSLLFRHGLTLADVGQNFGTYPRTFIVFAVLVVLVLALYAVNKSQKRKPSPEKLARATDRVRTLVPKNQHERRLWILVAITAGFCEEFLYRGWLLNLTGAFFHSVWIGLLISSIFFGFAHIYQGRSAILITGILGLVFGLIYIASGSLLPSQFLHTFLDITNGLAFGRLASRANSSAPPLSPSAA
jgi:CAAX protease family protein